MWEELIDHPDYEICNEYPYEIRNVLTHQVQTPHNDKDGYAIYKLGVERSNCRHHRAIASQWIPNPANLPEIDHIDRDRTNNHIENLRWVSHSTNSRNRASHKGHHYEFVAELPEDAIVVDTYGRYRFENYHYCDDVFYFFNGTQYRLLKINTHSNGGWQFVNMYDVDGRHRSVGIAKFKLEYNIIMT
jgi:hypothetical protein